jgi:steroid delta-isomerase-like uncharacterized protein
MQPTECIRAYYAAFNTKDWDAMLACVHDEVVHNPNQRVSRQGKALFREFILNQVKSIDEQLSDVVVFTSEASPNRVAAEYFVNGTYLVAEPGYPAAHGQTYKLPGGAFFEIKDGLIAKITNYYNLQDWFTQVGD